LSNCGRAWLATKKKRSRHKQNNVLRRKAKGETKIKNQKRKGTCRISNAVTPFVVRIKTSTKTQPGLETKKKKTHPGIGRGEPDR